METAKVDIRRLQLLNDRINQCIEALNQVRLSVHGLSHTSPTVPGMGAGWSPGLGGSYSPAGFGGSFAPAGFGGGYTPAGFSYPQIGVATPFAQGLSHTAAFAPQVPFPAGVPSGIPQPQAWPQAWPNPILGLSHTSPESFGDAFLAARIAQTFPYVQFVVPPVVSVY
jgi:hypothetical protein